MNPFESDRTDDPLFVPAGADRSGERHGVGVSRIVFKVTPRDARDLLVLEHTFHARGGPALHLHEAQDEWFYVLEGAFLMEVGGERRELGPGDALLAPRRLPHAWSFVGEERGRLLIAFSPAGRMEAFLREIMRADALPPLDPELWSAHGMTLLGPPLPLPSSAPGA